MNILIKTNLKMVKKENKNQYTASVGRRKEAIARIRLYQGKGEFMVNGRPIAKYFPLETSKVKWQKPFVLTSTLGKYFAQIKVAGSGKSGQLDAVVHGLARALNIKDTSLRPILKKAHLLTRDPRVKERRKYGLAQKARKGKQSPRR